MMRIRLLSCTLAAWAGAAMAAAPVVTCPPRAPRHREVAYHEVWRTGADDDQIIFGAIQDAVADDAGNLYLLDTQQQCVFKFSAGGEYLGTIVRKGEGPGEIDRVYSLEMIGADGLGMIKGFPGELIVVALDGTPRPTLRPTPPALDAPKTFATLQRLECRDGIIVCQGHVSHARGRAHDATDYVASLNADGTVRHCYGTKRGGYDFTRPITVDESGDRFTHGIWALGPHGQVYLAPDRDRWLIEVRDADGTLLRTITRDWRPHRRSAAEKEAAKRSWIFSAAELPPISYRIADTDPAITGLQFVGDVLHVHSTGGPKEPGADRAEGFEILDADDRLIESRSSVLPGRRPTDHVIPLDDGRLVCVKGLYAALVAQQAGVKVQVGDEIRDGSDAPDDEQLEVIVYAPEVPDAP